MKSRTLVVTVGLVLHSLVALHLIAFDIVLNVEKPRVDSSVVTDDVTCLVVVFFHIRMVDLCLL